MKYKLRSLKSNIKSVKRNYKKGRSDIGGGLKQGYEESKQKLKPYKPKIKKRIKKIATHKRGKEINRSLAKPVKFPKLI